MRFSLQNGWTIHKYSYNNIFNTSDGTTYSMKGILIGLQLSYVANKIMILLYSEVDIRTAWLLF